MAFPDNGSQPGTAVGQNPVEHQDKVDKAAAELRRRLGPDAAQVFGVDLIPGTGSEYHIHTTRGFSRQTFCDQVNAYAPSEGAKITTTDIRVYGPVDADKRKHALPGTQLSVSAAHTARTSVDVTTLSDSDSPRVFVIKEFYLDRAMNMAAVKMVSKTQ